MLGDAGYPGHAPPNYSTFHDANPHAISAERGNAAIDNEMARVQCPAEIAEELLEQDRAEQQRERENDKLAIPVATLKIILDHDSTVARLHTTQIQAGVSTRCGPAQLPDFWVNKRFRGRRGRGFRGVNQYRGRYAATQQAPTADAPMCDATPFASGAVSVFGTSFSFGDFAQAQGSSAFPTQGPGTQATPTGAGAVSEAGYEDFDMLDESAQASTADLTSGLASMALNTDSSPQLGQSET